MGLFIKNSHLKCQACGHGPFQGKESSSKRSDGKIYQECRWTCPRCTRMIRLDTRIIEPEKKGA